MTDEAPTSGQNSAGPVARWAGISARRRSFVIFLFTAIALLVTMNRGVNIFDEGIIYGGAMRVLAGQLVHRDFYSVYGPGSYAMLAGLFAVFGPGFLLGRMAGLLIAAATVGLAHLILARRTSAGVALGTAALIGLWMMTEPLYLAPIYPCMGLTMLAAGVMLRPGAARHTGALVGAGAICGLMALFRYDTGFFVLLALVLGVTATNLAALGSRRSMAASLRAAVLLGIGAGAVFLPFAAYYLAHAPLAAFRHDIIDYTVQYYGRMRGLPFPGPMDLLRDPHALGVYLPLMIVGAAMPVIVADWRTLRGARDMTIPASLLFALLAVLLFSKGMVRVSTVHMMMALVPATALAGVVWDRWTRRGGKWCMAARLSALVMVLAAGIGLHGAVYHFKKYPASATWVWAAEEAGLWPGEPDPVEACPSWAGMQGALTSEHYARIASYLARHSAPDDKVLVGLARTDQYVINSMFLNYAANRLPGTHWSQYDPGLQSRLDIQRQMVRELSALDVRWVVRDATLGPSTEPNDSALSTGVTLLDDTVAARYRPVGGAGGVSLWLRRDLAQPDASGDPAGCRLDPA